MNGFDEFNLKKTNYYNKELKKKFQKMSFMLFSMIFVQLHQFFLENLQKIWRKTLKILSSIGCYDCRKSQFFEKEDTFIKTHFFITFIFFTKCRLSTNCRRLK